MSDSSLQEEEKLSLDESVSFTLHVKDGASYTLPLHYWDVLRDVHLQASQQRSKNRKTDEHAYLSYSPELLQAMSQCEPLFVNIYDVSGQKECTLEAEERCFPETLEVLVEYLQLCRGQFHGELRHPPRTRNLFNEFIRCKPYQLSLEKLRWAIAHWVNRVTSRGLTFVCRLMTTAERLGFLPLVSLLGYRLAMYTRECLELKGTPAWSLDTLPEAMTPMPFERQWLRLPDPHDSAHLQQWERENPGWFGREPTPETTYAAYISTPDEDTKHSIPETGGNEEPPVEDMKTYV